MATVVGVDGCRNGWVAVTVGDGASVDYIATVADLPPADVIAVDMPMAFASAGRRSAEIEARTALGPRRSSLFFTTVRAAFDAPSHAAACEISREAGCGGISRQAYNLRAKIVEVEAWLPTASSSVYEVHPELAFATLLGAPAVHSKKTAEGRAERRIALAAAGIEVDGNDDVLDAAACAWTARRILTGQAVAFGPPGEPQIWA